MKLSKIAILAIRGSGPEIKSRIAEALSVSEATIYRWIQSNDDNLTKAAALRVIREELGISEDQLLTEDITIGG